MTLQFEDIRVGDLLERRNGRYAGITVSVADLSAVRGIYVSWPEGEEGLSYYGASQAHNDWVRPSLEPGIWVRRRSHYKHRPELNEPMRLMSIKEEYQGFDLWYFEPDDDGTWVSADRVYPVAAPEIEAEPIGTPLAEWQRENFSEDLIREASAEYEKVKREVEPDITRWDRCHTLSASDPSDARLFFLRGDLRIEPIGNGWRVYWRPGGIGVFSDPFETARDAAEWADKYLPEAVS